MSIKSNKAWRYTKSALLNNDPIFCASLVAAALAMAICPFIVNA